MRTVYSVKMCGARVWLVAASLHLLILCGSGARHHRRSMPTQATLPVSKGGWRPVISPGGLLYAGSYGNAQVHNQAYKIPVPVDIYQSSARPIVTRDSAKLTSIAQSYRPTTLRTVNTAQPAPPANQPISSYHNPFYSNGVSYKYIQNFPVESVLIRNPQNPYAARPVFKYPSKVKQSLQNTVLQQLANVQPIQFGQFQTSKPLETIQFGQYQTSKPVEYGKPVEGYARPDKHGHGHSGIETFKPEVFKLPDSETAPQQVSQLQITQHQGSHQGSQHQSSHQGSQPQGSHQGSQHQGSHQGSQHQGSHQGSQHQGSHQGSQHQGSHQGSQHQGSHQGSQHQGSHQGSQHQSQHQGNVQQQQQVKSSQQSQQAQQVKTAQQQALADAQKAALQHYAQYSNYHQDNVFPPGILGTFGSFGLQSVKGRDPYPTKTTYLQPTKQTIFNSFSYTPTFRTTPTLYATTTPRLQTTANHIQFGSTYSDYKTISTQPTKISLPEKIDPNIQKGSFKASPQDPFSKHYLSDYNKLTVTTYNPIQTTTLSSNHFDFGYSPQQNVQIQNYEQQTQNYNPNYHKKKQKIHHDAVIGASVNQPSQQYVNPPKSRPTYEVFETTEDITQSSGGWHHQLQYDSNPKTTEATVTKQLYPDTGFTKQTTTVADLPEEYAIVTEAEKGYENSLGYDSEVESQSRRPLGDDFEPIGKHKLKDYYYKVSTPAYDDYTTSKRTKKPTESSRLTTQPEVSTYSYSKETLDDVTLTPLPTLPPTQHFKRPTTTEPTTVIDKDKIRKRNKNRRRRPPLANINKDGATTRKYYTSTTELPQTTSPEEYHTVRPRIRPAKLKHHSSQTTPSVTTDLTTSAVPTISPTAPTIIKKKLVRRPLTTISERIETTTQSYKEYDSGKDSSKDSSIMKIATRPFPKLTGSAEIPDYTHKQDEKDTPTSDISLGLTDTLKASEAAKSFAFHKDVKPIEAKLETTTASFGNTEVTDSTSTNRNSETTSSGNVGKVQRPRLKNKYNRTRFSVKDYRNRLSSTTSTTERSTESTPKIRFPLRKTTTDNGESETTTERKKFTPKEPRHKNANGELNEETEKEIHSLRHSSRQRQTTADNPEPTTQKISSRIRNGARRPKPTEETPETTSPTTPHSKRPLRKKFNDSDAGESVQDISVTDSTVNYEHKNDITSERTRSESAIMKIADKKHHDHHVEHLFEHSKRVSDLTLTASKDYNTPGMFKSVSSNSRRIPNYFTIATDDPILPIEAFFPQLNQKKES